MRDTQDNECNGCNGDSAAASSRVHSRQELWRWTMTPAAVSSCFVKDAFEMRECEDKDDEFFWLGRVPCRYVRVVGLLVGVQVYEKRTVYSVDDGTAVIDCNYRHAAPQPASPKKPTNRCFKPANPSTGLNKDPSQSTAPQPIATVGMSVRIVGRVMKWHDTRVLNIDTIEPCHSSNDEPYHWLAVCALHRTHYFSSTAGPFIIPEPSQPTQPKFKISNKVSASVKCEVKDSKFASTVNPEPRTPSRSSVASSSVNSSPVSVASTVGDSQSPIRLRHPSRLHTRDLTANTFRIYLKHYMDNAPEEEDSSLSTDDEDDSPFLHGRAFPSTPTKRPSRELQCHSLTDMTPRPTRQGDQLQTPRPSQHLSTSDIHHTSGGIRGYTLSHLRRVPELHLLARRVVLAEAKRRSREERAKLKASQGQIASSSKVKLPSSVPTSGSRGPGKGKEGEPVGQKMKRLFRFAVRQLFEEGSIILWDGPIRPLPAPQGTVPSFLSTINASSSQNRLWKGDNTVLSSVSDASGLDDPGEISDTPPGEESYIPLTTPYLSRIIEQTISEIISTPSAASSSTVSSKLWALSITKSAPRPGPTASEILAYLRRRDERWERVGEWAVRDALDWGKEQGRVWCIGDGRWELCG
ncbi:hypothetical protein BXZ70DRAFT_889668 [Cristinia sonorae]|uniref:CST complex subunit STN1 n=1 Tax=Cristinia sonorae TaxID=1940300 RepID=A0A8K0USV0_9AGAR|nr:hypothetical protein BXZ70DRAFT_889668 [Cristinia sonorae]